MKNNKGFTLIELLVVVLIIGLLSAVALPQYARSVERARVTEVETIVADLRRGYKLYNVANPRKKGNKVQIGAGNVTLQALMKAGGFDYPLTDGKIVTKNFIINPPDSSLYVAGYTGCMGIFSANRNDGSYTVYFDATSSKCCQGITDSGKEVCRGLGAGWSIGSDSTFGELKDLYVSEKGTAKNN